ncbi:hypothetical protein RRG08_030819 [Elysia crispata]|uniref:Uncharacterized protein n=1 Tax=Elysia crispata TaxID=231223 RepID=A0AAE1DWX7_9GAST|nr:hypothetical protein RRG08_030819 [Elysia crispata]
MKSIRVKYNKDETSIGLQILTLITVNDRIGPKNLIEAAMTQLCVSHHLALKIPSAVSGYLDVTYHVSTGRAVLSNLSFAMPLGTHTVCYWVKSKVVFWGPSSGIKKKQDNNGPRTHSMNVPGHPSTRSVNCAASGSVKI